MAVIPWVLSCPDASLKHVGPFVLHHLLKENTFSEQGDFAMIAMTCCQFKARLVALFQDSESVEQK